MGGRKKKERKIDAEVGGWDLNSGRSRTVSFRN
jgi:hypothetical protein